MNIDILAIGKCRDSSILELIAEYQKRMRWNVSLKEFDAGRSASATQQEELLLKSISKNTQIVITLDERGQTLSSPEFAQKLGKWQDCGQSNIVFLIGGADGFSDAIRKKSNFLLSFGKQTWPHMLVRVMILEQMYRAQQIISGHPYHRS